MRDIHCHILPGVDDGAQSLEESLAMLQVARESGVSSIVCTPHVRGSHFNYQDQLAAFALLKQHAGDFPLQMGFEVNYLKLMDLGMEWAEKLCFMESREFLLELPVRASKQDFALYESAVYELQGKGLKVIIAHPERYEAIQQDIEVARRLVRLGCKLQVSADFLMGGRLGTSKKPAKLLLKDGLVSYIASDAHQAMHYRYLAKARQRYKLPAAHARIGELAFST